MRVSGLTLGYQAVTNGYQVGECIRSMLPIVDEVVANIGASDDGTREAVLAAGRDKVRLLTEPWDLSLREKGLLLSRETNRGMERCTGDWVLYLQADEVLHEDDLGRLGEWMERAGRDPRIDGLSFRYLHFYGSPRWVQDHPFRWYRRAVRAVKNGRGVVSVGDALKFRRRVEDRRSPAHRRMAGGRSLRVRAMATDVTVYHYGWMRPPEVMVRKQKHLDRFWHADGEIEKRYSAVSAATIYGDLGHLREFRGTHPAVMAEKVGSANWEFESRAGSQAPRWLRWLGYFTAYPLARLLGRARRAKV